MTILKMLVEQSFRKHNASGIYSVHAYFGLHDSPIRSAILYCFLQGLGSRHMAHCSYCPNAAASALPASRLRRMPCPGPLVASRTTPRLKAYEGALPPYDRTKRMVIPDTLKYVGVGLPSRSRRASCMCV